MFLLVVATVLLAARELWTVQAEAVGGLLDVAGVGHEVVSDEDDLGRLRVGRDSRGAEGRRPPGPVIELSPPRPRTPDGTGAAAMIVGGVALLASLGVSRALPLPLKGAALVVVAVAALSVAYLAWWSPRAPLDPNVLVVEWRTSVLVPLCAVSLLFAYDLFPLSGSLVLKAAWLLLTLVATSVFSVLRLALVAAGYDAFGHAAFLALWQAAGTFWDLLPGLAGLALAQASVGLSRDIARRGFRIP